MATDRNKLNVRRPAVAGTFYPGDSGELKKMADGFLDAADCKGSDDIRAIIVPHAGYVFSGSTAARAVAQIAPGTVYDRIFLLGPSHCTAFDGASADSTADCYATPLGNVTVDRDTARHLIDADTVFTDYQAAHRDEHCLEVQLPLLQRRLLNMPPIVPIVIGTQDGRKLRRMAAALKPYFNRHNLFVISSDFSHYPTYDDALKADSLTGKAIEQDSLAAFGDALEANDDAHYPQLCTSACGQCAIAVLLMLTGGRADLSIRHLAYCNSGDSPYGGKDRVVGYHAFAVTGQKNAQRSEKPFVLTDDEKQTLLKIARRSIENALTHDDRPLCDESEITPTLNAKCGAFVTLNEDGRLRGCIGNLVGYGALHSLVAEMARSAAFSDPRFRPVTAGEMTNIQIEISVLSPLRRITSPDQFTLGRHGIFMVKDGHSGTFLPQVADEVNWNKEEFLSHCAHDKAGLSWDEWRTADLYVYEAVVFSEKEGHGDGQRQ